MIKKGILKLHGVTILFAVVAVVTGCFTACSKDEEGAEYWTVTLEEHYAPYQNDIEGWKSVFGMRDNGEGVLFSEGEIGGFFYEEGYVYKLLIKATPTLQQIGTCNPPPYTFELVKVISKERMRNDDVI